MRHKAVYIIRATSTLIIKGIKMNRIFVIVIALLWNCSNRDTNGNEQQQAMKYCMNSRKVAEQWLGELDKNGYRYLSKMRVPEPFMGKYKGKEQELENELARWADTNEKVFGAVKKRKFVGVHVWFNGKLLTWLPNVEMTVAERIKKPEVRDHFCEIDPQNIGYAKASDIFLGFPGGNYAILIYRAVPVRKQSAEERLTVWQDPHDVWHVISYTIGNDH
jgi:hypothetical protein